METELEQLKKALKDAQERTDELEGRLFDIAEYAHERSTGPERMDALWAVREMAYELL